MKFVLKPIKMMINGRGIGPVEVPEGLPMLDCLHEIIGLTGSRRGCGIGECHACVVIHDRPDGTSEEVRTCIMPAHFFDGKAIRTIEGHATRNAGGEIVALSPVQQKFLEHYSFQCGYCTPGFVNGATVLMERLRREPVLRSRVESVITEALDIHLCRCTGYVRYYAAVKDLILTTPGLTTEG
jgi:xanthine dehydrogenase YagT iron-sulfur-binding subunit